MATKKKTDIWWAIRNGRGGICPEDSRLTKRKAIEGIEDFTGENWSWLRKWGYRAIKIEVREVPAKPTKKSKKGGE